MNRILRYLRHYSCMLIAVTFLMVGFGPICRAESSARVEKHAQKIEKKLAKYRTGTFLQVDFRDNSEALGSLGDVSDATFQLTNAESNKVQTFNFADVTRVRKTKEFIGAGSESEHHFHHWVPVLIGAAAAGGGIAAYEAIR
ncbi:MAG TPA: hypothetical protein VJX73_11010 [Terracidiphilus sp.]|nr:hypothetical protein [Terracidiphilus sp.]